MHSKEINWPFDTKDSRVSGTNCQVLINAVTGEVPKVPVVDQSGIRMRGRT